MAATNLYYNLAKIGRIKWPNGIQYALIDYNGRELIAEIFNPEESYNTGDYVLYSADGFGSELFYFTKNKTAGAWDSTAVQGPLTVGSEFKRLEETLKIDIDTDFSLTSTNPIQNKVISSKINDIDYKIMIIKEELFETILSEIDYKVDYATIYPIPETLSDKDGTHRVVYSDTQLKEVEGNSVAFNQLVQNGNFVDNSNWNAVSCNFSVLNNVATITPTNIHSAFRQEISITNGHKILYMFDIKYNNGEKTVVNVFNIQNYYIGTGDWEHIAKIITPTNTNGRFNIYDYDDTIHSEWQLKNVMIFDLTQMFGAGNEPTTVEEFNRIFPLTYYPYNAGEIKNTIIKGVNGYNLFDGIYEEGTIILSTGQNYLSSTSKRTPNYIKIISGQTYTFEVDNNGNHYFYEYDANKNFIKSTKYEGSTYTNNIQLTANTAFVRFVVDNATNNSCLHLTGTRTGYAPYKEPRIIEIPQTELPSAGSVHDTIKIVEGNVVTGQQRYNMVRVSRIGVVDLGTLNWTWQSANNRWFTSDLSTLVKVPTSNDNKANIIAEKYEILSFTNANTNSRGMALTNSGNLFYYTSDSTNAPSGILNYEKTEPTETTLATDLTFEEVSSIIEQGGNIETVFEIVPPNLKTAFVVNKAIVS